MDETWETNWGGRELTLVPLLRAGEMATIDDLPTETLEQITEESGYFWNSGTLVSAARVCRKWRDPAQRALFGRLRFRYDSERRVSHWLESAGRARFRVEDIVLLAGTEEFAREPLEASEGVRSLVFNVADYDLYLLPGPPSPVRLSTSFSVVELTTYSQT